MEDAAHFADGSILGNLKGIGDGLLGEARVPEGGTICEDGKDDGVEHPPPVCEGDPSDGVPKDSEGNYS